MSSSPPPKQRALPGRSCLECRRRKIRCDRSHPCAYCVKTKTYCIYPEVSASASQSDDANSNEVLRRRVDGIDERLHLLEQSMSEIKQLIVENNFSSSLPGYSQNSDRTASETASPQEMDLNRESTLPIIAHAPIREEVVDFSPITLVSMWQIYLERVDPLIKLFHTPTTQKSIMQAFTNLKSSNPATACLAYAVIYAVVMSMSPAECSSELQDRKDILLKKCRNSMDQSLSRVDVLNTRDMTVLQAFVLYLICGRLDPNGPNVHGLIGMAIGISIKMQLNHDGDTLGIPPFDVEMRRRLWWHILTLDALTAQDKKTDPCALNKSFNTKVPSNVNDSQLDPNMSKRAADRRENTEMIFALARFEITFYSRQFAFSDQFCRENSYSVLSTEEKRHTVDMIGKRIQDEYLQYADDTIPFQNIAASATRLSLLKLKLLISNRFGDYSGSGYDNNSNEDWTRYVQQVNAIKDYEKGLHYIWFFEDLVS